MNGKKRKIDRRHHKADQLPPELSAELARRFQAGETYESLSAWITSRGFPVGKSSIARWGAGFQQQLEKLRLHREMAQTIVAGATGKPATELNEAAEQITIQQITELLVALNNLPPPVEQEGADATAEDLVYRAKMLTALGISLSKLGASASMRERVKLDFDKRALAEKQSAVAKVAEAVGDAEVAGKSVVSTVREALRIPD
jgi:hypothetical protein